MTGPVQQAERIVAWLDTVGGDPRDPAANALRDLLAHTRTLIDPADLKRLPFKSPAVFETWDDLVAYVTANRAAREAS